KMGKTLFLCRIRWWRSCILLFLDRVRFVLRKVRSTFVIVNVRAISYHPITLSPKVIRKELPRMDRQRVMECSRTSKTYVFNVLGLGTGIGPKCSRQVLLF